MALLEIRRRGSTFLFLAVVVAHIVLISAQVTSKSGVPVLQAVTFGLVAQVQRAGAAVITGVTSLWAGYVDLRSARAENDQLKHDLAATKLLLQQERALSQRDRLALPTARLEDADASRDAGGRSDCRTGDARVPHDHDQ